MDTTTAFTQQLKKEVPDMRPGQVVRVHERIKEGNKERIQVFEGLVIAVKHGKGLNGMFTVRKMAAGKIGVERTFPLHLPAIEKIEILREEKVRRAKLYFVRDQVDKKTKKRRASVVNRVFDTVAQDEPEEEEIVEEEAAAKTEESAEVAEEPTEGPEAAEETPAEESQGEQEEPVVSQEEEKKEA